RPLALRRVQASVPGSSLRQNEALEDPAHGVQNPREARALPVRLHHPSQRQRVPRRGFRWLQGVQAMKRWHVIREVCTSYLFEVEAETAKEAEAKVMASENLVADCREFDNTEDHILDGAQEISTEPQEDWG